MDWISENLQIIATLGSALGVYIALRRAASKDANQLRQEFNNQNETFCKRFDRIESKLENIERRLTILETRFEERHYWEPKVIEKAKEE